MSSMNDQKMGQLLDRLLEKSRANACDWSSTGVPGAFRVPAAAGYVTIAKVTGKSLDKESRFVLSAFDESGSLLAGLSPDWRESMEECAKLEELWTLARQHAIGAPEKLDRLLQSFA